MATLTEMVAAVVVHSSAAAFSHFGVTLDPPPQAEQHAMPANPRVVSRTPARRAEKIERAAACSDAPHARVVKA